MRKIFKQEKLFDSMYGYMKEDEKQACNQLKNIPRIMFAGTNSGCGKTTIVCGILWALKNMGLKCSSVKCGPDYIDPMFHSQIFDIPSQNLDMFFSSRRQVRYLMAQNATGTDITVMEGVMGYFDGMAMDSTKASSYDLACNTDTPVILIINAKGMGLSVVPLIEGFLKFKPSCTDNHSTVTKDININPNMINKDCYTDKYENCVVSDKEIYKNNRIKGVILNGISKMTAKQLIPIIEERTHIKVIGAMPYIKDCHFEGRHLGLVTPFERDNIKNNIEQIGHEILNHIDIESIIRIAGEAKDINVQPPYEWQKYISKEKVRLRIAVAYDKSFCFYYKDNIELLKKLGCDIVFFSPLNDNKLPDGTDILLLGGGYPEIYAKELSENHAMLTSVKSAIDNGMFYLAECGGFMYLHERLEDEHGKVYNMAGVIKGKCFNTHRLTRFGYISIKQNKPYGKTENYNISEEVLIKGHEFHYWDSTNNGSSYIAVKPSGKRSWECIHAGYNYIAGYPHLYYYSGIDFINGFLERCRNIKIQKIKDGNSAGNVI